MDSKKDLVATLVFPIRNKEVLLGIKTSGIGEGCWNGWGGVQEPDETVQEAAVRELREESGLIANIEDLEYVGKVTFNNLEDRVKFKVLMHVFVLCRWVGVLEPNLSEMREPKFWSVVSLPFDQMMPSDRDWLPFVPRAFSRSQFFEAEVFHTEGQKGLREETKVNLFQKPPAII